MSDDIVDSFNSTSKFMSQDLRAENAAQKRYQSRFEEGLEFRREVDIDETFYSFVWTTVMVAGTIIALFGAFLLCYREFADVTKIASKLNGIVEKPAKEENYEKLKDLTNVPNKKPQKLSPIEVKKLKADGYRPLAGIPSKMSKHSFSGIQRAALDGAKKCQPMRLEKALDMGASPNLRDRNGETLLTWAIRIECSSSVEVLISNGANVNLANKKGQRPLVLAQRAKRRAIYKNLRQAGAS